MIEKIVLSGFAGTGKSSLGKLLADRLGYRFVSVGEFARELAWKDYGLSINAFQEKCKREPHLDEQIDSRFRDLCKSENKLVIDYRLGFAFVEDAYKVLLKASDAVVARRIAGAGRKNEDIEIESIKQRNEEMRRRFVASYALDFTDERHYDLVLDTDRLSLDALATVLIESFCGKP